MKLDVVMITYNHEQFIGQALSSVLAQQVDFDYQIVVSDDCSTDRTREIVKEFHEQHPGKIVLLLRERNLGVMRNFQETLATCHGQYVAILEGDDYWTCADKLQKQIAFLDAHPGWQICCSRAEVRNESGDSQGSRVQTGTIFPARPQNPLKPHLMGLLPVTPRQAGTYSVQDLLRENFIPTCTVVYRWGSPPKFPSWFSTLSLGDLPLHAIIAAKNKIELLDECMAVYRIHAAGSWSSRNRANQEFEHARMLGFLNRYFRFRYNNILGPKAARWYLEDALLARQRHKRTEVGKLLLSCLCNGGWQLPHSRRVLAGLAAYALLGSWYKIFSRAN